MEYYWFKPNINFTPATTHTGNTLLERNDAAQYREYGFHIRGTDLTTGRGYLYFAMQDNGNLHEYINGVLQTQTDPTGKVAIPSSTEITTMERGEML